MSRLINSYDAIADRYDDFAEVSGWRGPQLVYDAVREYRPSPSLILDVGSGTGLLSQIFKAQFPDAGVFATDKSANMLAVCKQKDRAHMYVQTDGKTMPFKSDSFDVIGCTGTLNYIQEIEDFAEELMRVTKRGGLIVTTFESECGWAENSRTRRPYSPRTIIDAFGEANMLSCTRARAGTLLGAEETNILVMEIP